MIVDLHSHSYYSDGVLSPKQLIFRAKDKGCDVLALTDHDTIDGIYQAEQSARELGIRLVKGVEISALWQGITIHIVALNIDDKNLKLTNILKYNQELRAKRAINIAKYLEQKNIKDPLNKIKKYAVKGMITRTHFARMLINEKVCSNMGDVFGKYLGNNSSVKAKWVDFNDVIKAIKSSGGLAVLAHPLRYKISKARLKVLIREFAEAGGRAVEIITSRTNNEQINHIMGLATENNLLFSMGSDFHGDSSFVEIGKIAQVKHPRNIYHYL